MERPISNLTQHEIMEKRREIGLTLVQSSKTIKTTSSVHAMPTRKAV